MLPQQTASRPRSLQRWRIATGALVALAVMALVGGTMTPAGAPTWSFRPATTTQTPTRVTWAPLTLQPYQPLAELSAARADASGVATTSMFVLRSKTATPALTLAAGLTASPPLEFEVEAGATPDVASLRPVSPLVAGARYRFTLDAPDGSLAGTWSFRVAGPLHVQGLLPRDKTTGVPVRTGIEVTFDQDDPTDFQAHFSISPEVKGSFEVHDRTWVFVPSQPLAPGTLYTYTVHAGVGITDSAERLESDVAASFETAPAGKLDRQVRFDRTVFDVRPGTAPLLGLWISDEDKDGVVYAKAPTSLAMQVYRFPSIDAAAAAASLLSRYSDDWLMQSSAGQVSTDGLPRVASFDARLTDHVESSYVAHVPSPLDPGAYLVVVPRTGRDAQAVIQVTDVAGYALSSTTRTIVWLNDLATGNPIVGATIALAGAAALGRTDARGLFDAPTPTALLLAAGESWFQAHARVLTVRTGDGHASIVPLGAVSGGHYAWNDPSVYAEGQRWWSVFSTDRTEYRTSDTIHAYGFVRTREGRAVPDDLAVRLVVAGSASSGSDVVPVATATVRQTTKGTFLADLAIRDLPMAGYELQLLAGTDVVATTWIDVTVIRKPLFSIDVQTDHTAYLAGDPIRVTATAAFFDGTTSPGLDLQFGTWNSDHSDLVIGGKDTTDDRGQAATNLDATKSSGDGASNEQITVLPARPEEGDNRTEIGVYVFPSAVWITQSTSMRNGSLRISGTASEVDIPTVERALATLGGLPDGPMGPVLAGQVVSVRVTHVVPARKLLRTEYDYVEKRTVPIYTYDTRDEILGTWQVTTGANGRYSLSVAVPSPNDSYTVVVRARDAQSRVVQQTGWVWRDPAVSPTALTLDGPSEVAIGQAVDLAVHDARQATPVGPYLWIVGRDGIQDAAAVSDGTFHRTFREQDLPDLTVRAVRLTAHGAEVIGDQWIRLASGEKVIHVELTPDQARYQPGDTATVAIRTTDKEGRPIAADVVVRAVDQKLFAIGGAWDEDSRWLLMSHGGPGFLQSYTSEFAPRAGASDGGGRGGGGGGYGRSDFRDVLTCQLISTDATGRGSVSFELSDDLTSWHVSASAFSAGLDAGDGKAILPVGLPFFVEATLAPDYLAGEQPVLRLRAYGEALRTGDQVRFVVSAPALGIPATTLNGTALRAIRLPLPALPAGDVRVTIEGQRVGDPGLADTLVRTIHVVPNRLTMLHTTYQELGAGFTPTTGVGLTTYLVTDAGRGSLVPLLQDLARGAGTRFDRLAAAEAARSLLASTFDLSMDDLQPTGFDEARYHGAEGIALLPYSTADLSLTAEAALVVPDQINEAALRNELMSFLDPSREPDVVPTREQVILAKVALAALGDDVIDDLRALEAGAGITGPLLGAPERLWLALGYLASGDEAAARSIERDVLSRYGREYGPWIRLEATRPDLTTGLMLLLAGSLGDPVATKLARYVVDNPSTERSYALEQLAYAKGMLDRLPRAAGAFAWTVDGQRHVETLDPGESRFITLTPAQQRTLSFERLDGALAVTTQAVAVATAGDLPSDARVTIERTVTPSSGAPETGLVRVSIKVTAPRDLAGCITVTDIVPSGLAPLASSQAWGYEYDSAGRGYWPYRVEGQRLSWCYDPKYPTRMTYAARVVSPGTYTWEPAVAQYDLDTRIGAATPTTTYTIN